MMLEWLKAMLGDTYTEELDTKVSAEIGKGFVAKADFNAKNEELKAAAATLKERDVQLEALGKSGGDAEALKNQITELTAQNAESAQAHAAQLAALRLDTAVERALSTAKAKNTVAAKALLAAFLKDARTEEDGTVRGLPEEIARLTAQPETAFMFHPAEGAAHSMAGATPAGSGTIGVGGMGSAAGGAAGGAGKSGTLAEAVSSALFGGKP